MKAKIECLSKGDFTYELPEVCLSEEEIRLTAQTGKVCEGSFTISNSMGKSMKGMIYSSNRLMRLDQEAFQGVEITVVYSFDAKFLQAGETIQGQITVISDCGEKSIPFFIQIELPFYITSLGKIKDLFQFTNLARSDWSEAKKVFRDEDFEHIFLANEERYQFLYRGLLESVSTSQALEEFLIAIHKKSVIQLTIDKTAVEYLAVEEAIRDQLILTKNHWGFAEIRISTDAPFLSLDQKMLWADQFDGNTQAVIYTINPDKLTKGKNYGHIWIRTIHQTITVQVTCKRKKETYSAISSSRHTQNIEYALVDNYLSFRLNRIYLDYFLEEEEALLRELPSNKKSNMIALFKAHMAIVSEKNKIAEELLSNLARIQDKLRKENIIEFCAYLYLEALYHKDEETITKTVQTIRHFYENGQDDWRILWFLLYTDKKYEKNKATKLADIKEHFDQGCHSPILYYEAVCIINEEPVLLRELSSFEIQVMNFGIKNWILTKQAAQQFTYLANKKKNFHPLVFRGLIKLYDDYDTPEVLSAICCTLIKGMKKSPKYFDWYRLGVEKQLRITDLYEYYMYSINHEIEEPLAQPVLLYFIYNSNLNDKKKAFLYANIIKNKEKNEPIYRSYSKKMEVFAFNMLSAGHISKDLAVLYKEFMDKYLLNAEIAKQMPYVMYQCELTCNNPNIIGVTVVHKELGMEEKQLLVEGYAKVNVFTRNVEIFLLDSVGNRYVESIEYAAVPYLVPEEYEDRCLEYTNHTMLLLHLFDRYQSHRVMTEHSISLRRQVLQISELNEEYITKCYQVLVEYYYERYNDERMEYYLDQINLKTLPSSERIKFLEYMVVRALYHKAIEALDTFGYEDIGINRLVKLCSGYMLTQEAKNREASMVSLCYYVFSNNKYDEAILKYLVEFYNGTTSVLLQLWQSAKNFDLKTDRLEERILTQMLYTETNLEDSFRVFREYYKNVTNKMLVTAYLSFYAYKYVVWDQEIHTEVYPIMKRELNYEENDLFLTAWLKKNISNQKMTEGEQFFVEFNIISLVKKGIILPFLAEYHPFISLPDQLLDKCFITYKADPKKQVYIHYRLLKEKEQEYITERMPNVFHGIHLKELVLFYHETVQYYITEETSEEAITTEIHQFQFGCESPQDVESKYNQINLMLMAKEAQDDNTLLNMMESYVINETMIAACFQQIN